MTDASRLGDHVRPQKRILVRMVPRVEDFHNPLNLTLMDSKAHWDHAYRRGVVTAMDNREARKVPDVSVGDTVLFTGSAGFTLDGDILDEDDRYDDPLKGESWRWLKAKELLAVEEKVYA